MLHKEHSLMKLYSKTLQSVMLKVWGRHGIWNQVNMDNFWSNAISNVKKEKSEFEEKFNDVKKDNVLLP